MGEKASETELDANCLDGRMRISLSHTISALRIWAQEECVASGYPL
jgi:hypothetical protein